MDPRMMMKMAADAGGAGGGSGDAGAGGDGKGESVKGQGQQDAGNGQGAGAPEKKYTDAEVNEIIKGKQGAAVDKLLKELGLESTGSLKEKISKLKEYEDKGKSEAEKAAALAQEADKRAKDAEARATLAEIRADALALGVDPKKIDRAVKLIPAYDGDTPAKKVEAFITENPEFKAAAAPAGGFGAPSKSQGDQSLDAMRATLEKSMGMRA